MIDFDTKLFGVDPRTIERLTDPAYSAELHDRGTVLIGPGATGLYAINMEKLIRHNIEVCQLRIRAPKGVPIASLDQLDQGEPFFRNTGISENNWSRMYEARKGIEVFVGLDLIRITRANPVVAKFYSVGSLEAQMISCANSKVVLANARRAVAAGVH